MLEKSLLQRVCYFGSQWPAISSACSGYRHHVRHVSSSQGSVEKNGFKKKDNLNFPEKTVTVYSCENIYDKWKKDRTFNRVPKSGVYATMRYIDTFEHSEDSSNKRRKTVLCIHGIPGNYGIFSYLIKALSDNGIRVIVPTFPQSLFMPGKYQKELFRHSLEEKTQVFKDFLKVIKVSEIDCIVAHSSGIYPALQLMRDPNMNGKCQVFFNTGGHKPTVTMRPYWAIQLIVYLYLNSLGRILIQKTGRFLMKYILRTPIRNDDVDGIALLGVTMVFSEFWKTKDIFDEIAKKEIPTLYIFSEDDKVVERELTYKILSLLGASKENVNFYDAEGKLQTKGSHRLHHDVRNEGHGGKGVDFFMKYRTIRKDLPWLKLLSFKEGSHYVFRKHPEVCNDEVLQLLKTIKTSNEDSSEIKS